MWIRPRRLGWRPKDLEKKQSEELRESSIAGCFWDGAWPTYHLSPSLPYTPPPQHLPQGIAFSNGPRWPMLHNFALGALKEFGLGMRTIEERVLEEAACLLGEILSHWRYGLEKERDHLWAWTLVKKGRAKAFGWNEASNPRAGWDLNHPAYDLVMFPPLGAPFEPRRLLDNAVSNVICSMVFGNRYGNEDMEFLRLLNLFNDNVRIMSSRWEGRVPSLCETQVHGSLEWGSLRMLEVSQLTTSKSGSTGNYGLVQGPVDFLSPQMYNIFPSLLDWLPGPHH